MNTILDHLWLWGMPVNAIQSWADSADLHWPESRLTVEGAIRESGIANICMAGGLEINESSLALMPSARRIICKWELHRPVAGSNVRDVDACITRLDAAKRLALKDSRICGFLVDDFSTGSMDSGITPDDVARFRRHNEQSMPRLPLMVTVYTMSLERPGLAEMLRYFDRILVPLWHVNEIESFPQAVERCAQLSGGKPMTACIYFYDFGNGRMVDRPLMQRQLDVAEPLLRDGRIEGLLLLGTCMMDLGWESVRCAYEWIARVGGDRVATTPGRAGS